MKKEKNTITPKNAGEWRNWLAKNHESKDTIWINIAKKNAPFQTVTRDEAVDEALCYGWIDALTHPLDEHSYSQSFCPRKPKSVWSKINKDKITALTKANRMQPSGLAAIEVAKANGSWAILDDAEAGIIPQDLEKALKKKPAAQKLFDTLSPSDKKRLLTWLVLAQRPETRQKRIDEIINDCAAGSKPKYLG